MGVLKIECFLNETEMSEILKTVSNYITQSDYPIADFDDCIGKVRVCIDFDQYLDKLEIKAAEILGQDWEVLIEDSVVFLSRLKRIIYSTNKENRELISQTEELRKDMLSFQHC